MAHTTATPASIGACVPRLLSIKQAAYQLGLGRTSIYELLAAGKLKSLKIGRRRCIPREAIDEFIAGLAPQGGAA